MRTRQSTANITHHDATHTFFIYMTTKTALKRTERKTKYCDSLEIFLVLTPRFYFLLFAIAWHSPRILGIIVQLLPEIFIHKIQQVHCCFFFFYPVYFPLLLLEMVWIMHTCFDQVRSAIASESTDSYCLH